MNPKQLYTELAADFKAEKKYYFAKRGEGILQGMEKDSYRVFLVNTKNCEAVELRNEEGVLSHWDLSAVDMTALHGLNDDIREDVMAMTSAFYFGFNEFEHGIASVNWMVQPDGQYWADSDGFGMTNDEEIEWKAFIDREGNVLIPFQPMDKAMEAKYRMQALKIKDNPDEVSYISLQPGATIF